MGQFILTLTWGFESINFNVGLIFYMFDYVGPYIACIFTNVGLCILGCLFVFSFKTVYQRRTVNSNVGLHCSYSMN